jgi:hypothetical protein
MMAQHDSKQKDITKDVAAYSKAIYDYTRSLWDQARQSAESRAKENATTVRKPKHESPIRNGERQ